MSADTSISGALDRRRSLVMGVTGLAPLMVVLDLTVMNIALPSAQRELSAESSSDSNTCLTKGALT